MRAPEPPASAVGAPDSVLIASTGVADSVIVVRAAGFSLSGGPIQRSVASVYCWITFHSSVPSLTGLRAMNWKESYWLGGMRLPLQRTTATRSPSFWRRTFQPGASRTISDSTSAGTCSDTDTTSELRSLGTVRV